MSRSGEVARLISPISERRAIAQKEAKTPSMSVGNGGARIRAMLQIRCRPAASGGDIEGADALLRMHVMAAREEVTEFCATDPEMPQCERRRYAFARQQR